MGNAKIIPAEPERVLLPYQRKWAFDPSRMKLCEKGRQVGLSLSTAAGCVERTGPANARLDQWISSRDEDQAILFIEDINKWAKVYQIGCTHLGRVVIDKKRNLSALVSRFANGRRVFSMSSNPDKQAGKKGGRVLDEFALHRENQKLYDIAYHGITWGGQLEIISTHRGSYNLFAKMVNEAKHEGNPKRFSLHRVTLQDALEQGFLYKLQQFLPPEDERQDMDETEYFDFIRAGCSSEEQFQQECMCNPADDLGAFLSYDLIASCEYPKSEKWEMAEGFRDPTDSRVMKNLYLGMDIGRRRDLSVIWLFELLANVLFTRAVVVMDKWSYDAQEAELHRFMQFPGVHRACIDRTGIGDQFAERAINRYGNARVEGIQFTAAIKESLAHQIRETFENKQIRIPQDDVIRADFRAIRKEITAAGNIRFTATHTDDGHADRFTAASLARHASGNLIANEWDYDTAGPREAASGLDRFAA